MKAAVLTEINSPLEIKEVDLTSLKIGQVKVKILTTGICGAQLQEIKGNKGNAKFIPHLLGHEACGIVEEIGQGVQKVQAGDKVILHWRKSSGIESDFPEYLINGNITKSGKITTFSEKAIISENRLTKVPAETDNDLATLLGCGLSTAFGIISNELNYKLGESGIVIGCGGVGLSVIKGLSLVSCSQILGVDISSAKEKLALEAGADIYLNLRSEDFSQKIEKITRNFKPDFIIDTSGDSASVNYFVNYLSDAGRIVIVGQFSEANKLVIDEPNKMFGAEGKQIIFTQGGNFNPDTDIPRYLSLFSSKKLSVQKLITHRFTLDKINEAISTLANEPTGRVIIDVCPE